MMSIRLRLTLLYSTILALTLIIFGTALYSIQAQDTLNSLKHDLIVSSERLVGATSRTPPAPPPQDTGRPEPPPPRPFDEFSNEQAFRALPEREIARVLDASGNLVASPFGSVEDALPLSSDGLAALQSQQDWWESDRVSGENMLIYNRPIVRDGETIYIVQVARSLAERDRTLKSLATTLGGAGLLTILVAFGAGWVLSGLTLRPIHRITQTAQAIGDERDFTRRVAYTGPQDEVGQLASTFSQMLARLQDAYQKVEHSLEMQRRFVADVSHELRTPLTTLRGNLGLLGRIPPPPHEEQADILVDMVDESDRLIRLVNELLLLARADAGRNLNVEPLTIQPVLEETIRQAHQLDLKRQITLDVSPEVTAVGDRDAFKQVMLILLDNALKHSDGDIHVEANGNGAQVEIRVHDHGRGISPDELDHVFDRFYRGDDGSIGPGFGLGLPIAKTLTEGMGGIIAIESELGKGSIVILRFSAVNSLPRTDNEC
jgi:two-component system OmpR family sensor kinase